jgi:hypothetical protein
MPRHGSKKDKENIGAHQYVLTLGRFRRVANISLWVALIAVLSLLALIFAIEKPSKSYVGSILNLAITLKNLHWMMALAACWLLAATAATTWFITLYSSFRVAGPLYRLSRNLEHASIKGYIELINIRGSDLLQHECRLLDEVNKVVQQHFEKIAVAATRLEEARKEADPSQIAKQQQALTLLLQQVNTDA